MGSGLWAPPQARPSGPVAAPALFCPGQKRSSALPVARVWKRFARVEKVPGTTSTGRTKVSEKPHPGRLGCGFLCRRVEKVAGTENPKSTAALRHRQSGAPLLAALKESGSGDGTGGRRPDGGRPSG